MIVIATNHNQLKHYTLIPKHTQKKTYLYIQFVVDDAEKVARLGLPYRNEENIKKNDFKNILDIIK